VDPSFQVMGDMLDKILVPLQQKRCEDEEDDDDSVHKINRATNTGSVDSLKSSESAPASPRMSDKGIYAQTPLFWHVVDGCIS